MTGKELKLKLKQLNVTQDGFTKYANIKLHDRRAIFDRISEDQEIDEKYRQVVEVAIFNIEKLTTEEKESYGLLRKPTRQPSNKTKEKLLEKESTQEDQVEVIPTPEEIEKDLEEEIKKLSPVDLWNEFKKSLSLDEYLIVLIQTNKDYEKVVSALSCVRDGE